MEQFPGKQCTHLIITHHIYILRGVLEEENKEKDEEEERRRNNQPLESGMEQKLEPINIWSAEVGEEEEEDTYNGFG